MVGYGEASSVSWLGGANKGVWSKKALNIDGHSFDRILFRTISERASAHSDLTDRLFQKRSTLLVEAARKACFNHTICSFNLLAQKWPHL